MVDTDGSEEEVDVLEEEEEERRQQSGSEEEEDEGKGKESEESSSSSEGQDSGSGDSSDGGSVAGSGGGSASSGSSSDSGGDEEGDKDDDEGEDEEEEEEGRDLFGSDNEEYVRTPAVSLYPIPSYPRAPNNLNRGNSGRGRWQPGNANDRGSFPPLLPLPGPYQQRQNHGSSSGGFKFQQGGRRSGERLVAELKLAKIEDMLSRRCPAFQEPCEIACYSRAADGNVYYDDRCLRPFRHHVLEEPGADLNEGFETFVEKREDLECQGFGDLLSSIRNKNIPLDNIHFVTFRNNLNKILGTAYNRFEPWEMGVHKRRNTVYLDVHKLPERTQSEMDRRRCYWGYSFEQLATKSPNGGEGEDSVAVDANVEYCAVIRTKLGAHRIIMGAEMDCYDNGRDGRKYYVELKTSRELDAHTAERFERDKLLKFWIQSFLAGVPRIVIGFRDDAGRLLRCQAIGTKDITHKVKMKNYWQGGVCLAFADEVLCWLYGTVKENEDYILQFLPSANRLELLQANSCPVIISSHIEQL